MQTKHPWRWGALSECVMGLNEAGTAHTAPVADLSENPNAKADGPVLSKAPELEESLREMVALYRREVIGSTEVGNAMMVRAESRLRQLDWLRGGGK